MSRQILVSAPGKVIVLGEHAVVYGKRALAASLGLRTNLTLHETNDGAISLHLPDIGVAVKWPCSELIKLPVSFSGNSSEPKEADAEVLTLLKKLIPLDEEGNETKQLAVVAFLYLLGGITKENEFPSFQIEVHSALPASAGLGSSAAFGVCLATGLLLYAGKIAGENGNERLNFNETDLTLINQWAFMAEKIIHGRPSGIDNSVSTYGGALCFQSGKITPMLRMPNLKILLVNTKIQRSTKVLVEKVRRKCEEYPEIVRPIFDSIEGITSKFESLLNERSLSAEAFETIKDLVDMNQQLLAFLGVSHAALDDICRSLACFGLSTKLTGAGGGGCAMALIANELDSEVIQKAVSELSAKGFDCFETSIGGPGVAASVELLEN